jgi:hypothetical protein
LLRGEDLDRVAIEKKPWRIGETRRISAASRTSAAMNFTKKRSSSGNRFCAKAFTKPASQRSTCSAEAGPCRRARSALRIGDASEITMFR